jgi:hypothetical protein
VAPAPFQWQSKQEIDATPIRVVRFIEAQDEIYVSQCGK